jgi:hypothetical protein
MASVSVIAALTDEGSRRIADMTISGRGFQITEFVVGKGGHDSGDPTVALTPNRTVSVLPLQTFGPKALVSPAPGQTGILVTAFCPQFTGLLDLNEANGELSNIGLIGTINHPPGDPLVGTKFLFAIGNRPLVVKTDSDQLQINVTLQT